MIGEYYTAEVAAILGCSTGNVRNMVFREKIREVMKLNPRMSLVHSNEVERLRRNPLKVGRPRKKFPGQLDKDCDVVYKYRACNLTASATHGRKNDPARTRKVEGIKNLPSSCTSNRPKYGNS